MSLTITQVDAFTASSRPGTQPANLQGLWNDDVNPAWGSKYTININTEMNYWPAEVTNLAECHQPLFDLVWTFPRASGRVRMQWNAAGQPERPRSASMAEL